MPERLLRDQIPVTTKNEPFPKWFTELPSGEVVYFRNMHDKVQFDLWQGIWKRAWSEFLNGSTEVPS